MKKLSCAIIDDEPLARQLLRSYVEKTTFLDLKGEYASAAAAMEDLTLRPVDLTFLDIQMPELDGMQFSRMLPTQTKVIFTTAFSEYAVEGFRVNALDYLKKPINYADFLESANKAMKWFNTQTSATEDLTPEKGSNEDKEFIYVKSDYKLIQIPFAKLLYVEGLKDYLKIFLEDQRPILTLMSMKSLEDYLPTPPFMRIHRSYLVNMNKVNSINKGALTIGGQHLPISDGYKDELQKFIAQHTL